MRVFDRPTVLTDVTDDNIVAGTEVFGPVASVLRYSDIDEVLARANGARMGLTAQIWGNDARAIQYLARRLEAGTVWVNTTEPSSDRSFRRDEGERIRPRERIRRDRSVYAIQGRGVGPE